MLINLIVDSVPNVESLEMPNCIDPGVRISQLICCPVRLMYHTVPSMIIVVIHRDQSQIITLTTIGIKLFLHN